MSDWTDRRIAILRELWSKGLSARQIAEQLGDVSRNAVIGKAHREGLDSRPSPIRAKGTGSWEPRVRSRVIRAEAVLALVPVIEPETLEQAAEPDAPSIQTAPVSNRGCQYPRGEKPNFDFCGAPRNDGSSYCRPHHRITHYRITDKRVNLETSELAAA